MLISTRGRYGLRFMLELCRRRGGPPVLIGEVAAEHGIPESSLLKLAAALRRRGLVVSYRGPGGGYTLAREPEQITLLEVVEALEGNLGRVTGTSTGSPADPGDAAWSILERAIADTLGAITLQAILLEAADRGPDFQI